MSYAIATHEEIPFKRFLLYSALLHLSLTVLMLVGVWIQRSGNMWGGIGGEGNSNVRVSLVSSAGIPLP